jgi:hypothetical protein
MGDVVVTDNAGFTVMLREALVAVLGVASESVTVTVKVVVPAVVGVPEIAPVTGFKVSPGGRLVLPPTTVQLMKGWMPPAACKVTPG